MEEKVSVGYLGGWWLTPGSGGSPHGKGSHCHPCPEMWSGCRGAQSGWVWSLSPAGWWQSRPPSAPAMKHCPCCTARFSRPRLSRELGISAWAKCFDLIFYQKNNGKEREQGFLIMKMGQKLTLSGLTIEMLRYCATHVKVVCGKSTSNYLRKQQVRIKKSGELREKERKTRLALSSPLERTRWSRKNQATKWHSLRDFL